MRDILLKITAIFSAIFGVFFLGKKYARRELELNQQEDLLAKKLKQNEINKKLDNIDDNERSKLVQKWIRK